MARNEIVANDSKQYIVVRIDNERYGIDITFVDNIVRMQKITRVPKAQPYFKGVINLRGEVVPVMSMRLRMEQPDDVYTGASRIIIVKMEAAASCGLTVDEVIGVVVLENSEIDRMNNSKDDKQMFINGIGKHEGQLISLLDLNKLIGEIEPE
ncbi:purine-binding chemotaxis protein CheW [Acetitomaculum ruminis DSM 5522]|uniref:Purine-binding chemotaxis protein CheW n=1 Tax=Acetitomaculum ruminis DSM 5522 TaxID=1120918 RepID=A0A1I0ZJP4_9FIRM|nr:chemotaxis protein CheW [Acetitomaculum ruminis]SFB25336.1 purine-binding chemotaxis protein CheW [Acetitomaculum ruminis DSM 5522]